MLQELTNLREGSLSFTDDPSFLSHDETRDIIAYNMFALIVFACIDFTTVTVKFERPTEPSNCACVR